MKNSGSDNEKKLEAPSDINSTFSIPSINEETMAEEFSGAENEKKPQTKALTALGIKQRTNKKIASIVSKTLFGVGVATVSVMTIVTTIQLNTKPTIEGEPQYTTSNRCFSFKADMLYREDTTLTYTLLSSGQKVDKISKQVKKADGVDWGSGRYLYSLEYVYNGLADGNYTFDVYATVFAGSVRITGATFTIE